MSGECFRRPQTRNTGDALAPYPGAADEGRALRGRHFCDAGREGHVGQYVNVPLMVIVAAAAVFLLMRLRK